MWRRTPRGSVARTRLCTVPHEPTTPYCGTAVRGTGQRGTRSMWTRAPILVQKRNSFALFVAGTMTTSLGIAITVNTVSADQPQKVDWNQIRKEIVDLLEARDEEYDDGSYGPIFIRLAWHASGTYDKNTGKWGSNGATMRFQPEAGDGANNGLAIARVRLEPIKRRHPEISFADLWTFAGVVAVEEMGGPKIPWTPGRSDATSGDTCPPNGNLPDASKGEDHVREIFGRMGFNDQEMVALIGAHAVGRCHRDRSGYNGPWTQSPTFFSNSFFHALLDFSWKKKNWDGPEQYEDESGELMMLPADMVFLKDPQFKKWVLLYAQDEERFFADFASAFGKLLALGVPTPK